MNECYPDRSRTARRILEYLTGCPGERDTLDGIIEPWLRDTTDDRHAAIIAGMIKEVLDDLVTQGRVRKVKGEGEAVFFNVHRDHKNKVI